MDNIGTALGDMIESLRADAARYRALRDNACMSYPSAEGCESKDAYIVVTGFGHERDPKTIDHAVDEIYHIKHGE